MNKLEQLKQLKEVYEEYKDKGLNGLFLVDGGTILADFEDDLTDEVYWELMEHFSKIQNTDLDGLMYAKDKDLNNLGTMPGTYIGE